MPLTFSRLETSHLVLEPLTRAAATAIVAGDLSELAVGDGWPHDDTCDGLRMALELGHAPGWLITLDGIVIGDCGVHGEPDATGDVEIGYGLAAGYRRRGYGSEVVAAAAQWLLAQDRVRRVVANDVLRQNLASRRALQGAGFRVEREDPETVSYALGPSR